VTVVLKGQFSPQTTVLVNGKRLNQVVGLGKPILTMDSGTAEEPGSGVIHGSFELVNDNFITLSLNVPTDFKKNEFPAITLISPSRTATINDDPMYINGKAGLRLKDQRLLLEPPTPFSLKELRVLQVQTHAGQRIIVARLSGTKLSKLSRIWMNGQEVRLKEPVSDDFMMLHFPEPDQRTWEITGSTDEDMLAARKTETLIMKSPTALVVAAATLDNVEYDKLGEPKSALLLLSGRAFTPDLVVQPVDPRIQGQLHFVSDEECSVRLTLKPKIRRVTFNLTDGVRTVATPAVEIGPKPKEPSPPKPQGKTTVTQVTTEKTVIDK
jgi:hypothetical protein